MNIEAMEFAEEIMWIVWLFVGIFLGVIIAALRSNSNYKNDNNRLIE